MAELTKPRVKVPSPVKAGEVIEVKTLIQHPMENGLRKDSAGKIVPQDIISSLVATFNGAEVYRAKLATGTAANPYLSFFVKVPAAGELALTWTDDQGKSITDKQKIEVN